MTDDEKKFVQVSIASVVKDLRLRGDMAIHRATHAPHMSDAFKHLARSFDEAAALLQEKTKL